MTELEVIDGGPDEHDVDRMRRDLAAWFNGHAGFVPLWLGWLVSGEIASLEEVVDFSDLDEDSEAAITAESYARDHGVTLPAARAALYRAAKDGTLRRVSHGRYALP